MLRGLGVQRLVALFVAGWLLFNAPLLRVWMGDAMSLFVAWGGLIAALAWWMERHDD